ncbi:MAG: hypothetical protein Q9208_000593 [Pyrenodesmia sp. 3 TL-2023]
MHNSPSAVGKKVDFHAIEAKWNTIWAAKESKLDKSKYRRDDFRPLSPLRFSILAMGNRCNIHGRDGVEASSTEECGFFGHRLPFATPKESDEFSTLLEKDRYLQLCIQDFGLDVARTCMVFGVQGDRTRQCTKTDVRQIQGWFESIWEAISIAHTSYILSQAHSSHPDIPAALYEHNIDDWEDSLVDETRSLVHIPPREPNPFDSQDSNQESTADDDNYRETPSREEVESVLAEAEEEWEEGYQLLPRQRFPETLPSLFELCPPAPASTEAMRILRRRVDASRCEISRNE